MLRLKLLLLLLLFSLAGRISLTVLSDCCSPKIFSGSSTCVTNLRHSAVKIKISWKVIDEASFIDTQGMINKAGTDSVDPALAVYSDATSAFQHSEWTSLGLLVFTMFSGNWGKKKKKQQLITTTATHDLLHKTSICLPSFVPYMPCYKILSTAVM